MNRPCLPTSIRSVSLALLLLLALCSCSDEQLTVSTPPLDRRLPDETSENVTITEFNGTKIDYVLKAARIERFNDRKILNAYKVDITAYDSRTGDRSKLMADSTIVDDARNLILANGNVKMESPGGSVASSRMVWDRNLDLLTAPGKVTLVRDGNVLRGENLRTNTRVEFAEMEKISAEGVFGEEYLDW